jgi:hypothetical protein
MHQRPIVRVAAIWGLAAGVLGPVPDPAAARTYEPPPAEADRRSCAAEPPPGAIVAGPEQPTVVTGTEADDVIYVTAPGKTIRALAGDDIVCSGLEAGGVVIDAGPGADYVNLTNEAADVIYGGPGNDMLWSAGGDDRVYGDEGNDRIFAGRGNDNVSGGMDNDQLRGGAGDDSLYGDDGNDFCQGDADWDSAHSCERATDVEQAGG